LRALLARLVADFQLVKFCAKIQNSKMLLAALFSKMRNVNIITTQHRRRDATPLLYSNPWDDSITATTLLFMSQTNLPSRPSLHPFDGIQQYN
jgi:hypothetical protein